MSKLRDYVREVPSLYGDDSKAKRQEILEYFLATYALFEKLFDPFVDESVFYEQPEPTRHPLIFYYGHTATFFINKLMLSKVIDQRINPEFESIFAIGVDEMSWDDLERSHYSWPKVAEVKAYREAVKALIVNLIKTQPLHLPITWEDPFWWVLLMGIEHENIHLETSSVLHRQLSIEHVKSSNFWMPHTDASSEAPKNSLVSFDQGEVRLGKSLDDDYYAWDNEYGREIETFERFEASKYLVSNAEFSAFVSANGYKQERFWSEEGWQWLQANPREYPHFWIKKEDGSFWYRSMLEEMPMPQNWPVDVNFHEAEAFCNYKSEIEGKIYTLPSEAQWQAMLQEAEIEALTEGNIDLRKGSSACAVDKHKQGRLYDVCGNVWQWTRSYMDGYEGFKTHPIYDDFSTPTFDNMHNLLKGGSWISTGNETRVTSRYAFRRHFMQHAGFRYIVVEKEQKMKKVNSYESDTQVSQYCDFHYGPNHFGVENFAQSLATISSACLPKERQGRALDLGCAVGRASFELAHTFESVTGVDFSARFIQVGTHLKEGGEISYRRQIEGDIFEVKKISLEELGYDEVAQKVEFVQGDACNLKPILTGYDLVMAVNLIDRLYEPHLFLDSIKERLNSEGVLVIASPYTWLEEFTQKEHWLGGQEVDGKAVRTIDALREYLSPHFEELKAPQDVEFVIRETERKFQHTLSQVSFWKKRH